MPRPATRFFFSSRRRHTRFDCDWSSDVCSSDLTPIKNVKYSVENTRVEQRTDYEKLIIEVNTDGTIHPEEAVKQASRILIQHLMIITDENKIGRASCRERV